MSLILYFMMAASFILMMSSHPVMILAAILIQTTLVCLVLFLMISVSWFSFILFLIFLGGLMVLFVYIVSLASNEKFELMLSENYSLMVTLSLSTIILTAAFFFLGTEIETKSQLLVNTLMIFSKNLIFVTHLIMFYLLFTLIVAVKISSKFEGPLRNFSK